MLNCRHGAGMNVYSLIYYCLVPSGIPLGLSLDSLWRNGKRLFLVAAILFIVNRFIVTLKILSWNYALSPSRWTINILLDYMWYCKSLMQGLIKDNRLEREKSRNQFKKIFARISSILTLEIYQRLSSSKIIRQKKNSFST